jgi:glycosyltransferase involved in cell wall biosynthesis
MVASSYPRFEGDTVGTFMEPIATGMAARGHDVHLVLPWHPLLTRASVEKGVHFYPFHYAPLSSWHVFGYAGALKADVHLKATALAVAPIAVAAGWAKARSIAKRVDATLMHGHWVIPGGAIASWAAGKRPLVVSLHGSDVYLAEQHAFTRAVAQQTLRRAGGVIACSDDLRDRAIALGARAEQIETIPYGVDTSRFRPDGDARVRIRQAQGLPENAPIVFAIGRFVRKKGFQYLIDAVAQLSRAHSALRLVLAGWGDLEHELRAQIDRVQIADRVLMPGLLPHHAVPAWLAAADVVAVPAVRDDAGNVDGLPNVVLEALASATPVVATRAGGIAAVVHHGTTGLLVPERDPQGLAEAIERVLTEPSLARSLGTAARQWVIEHGTWADVAARIEGVYDRAADQRRVCR